MNTPIVQMGSKVGAAVWKCRFTFTAAIPAGDTVTGGHCTVASGTATVSAVSFDAATNAVTFTLSGGTAPEECRIIAGVDLASSQSRYAVGILKIIA